MFKKVCGVLFVLLVSISLTGCKTKEKFNIEDDIGEVMEESIAKVFDDTSYIVYDRYVDTVTIDNREDIDKLINIIKNSRKQISNDTDWVEHLSYLYFYNDNDEKIASVNLRDTANDDFPDYYRLGINNNIYYVNTNDIESVLSKYSE